MLLDKKTRSLAMVLGEAKTTNEVDVVASYYDSSQESIAPISQLSKSSGVAQVTIVSAPVDNTERRVKEITLCNHDTVPHSVYIFVLDGATTYYVTQATLASGQTLQYTEQDGWKIPSFGAALAILIPDGTVGAPGLAFLREPSTGFYRPAAGKLGVSVLGTEVVEFRSALFVINQPINYGGINWANSVTGTGSPMLNTSPTSSNLTNTGTLTAAAANFSGAVTFTSSGSNTPYFATLTNANAGNATTAAFNASNGTHIAGVQMNGTGKGAYVVQTAGSAGIYTDSARLWFQVDNASGVMRFGNNTADWGGWDIAGNFLIGTPATGGWTGTGSLAAQRAGGIAGSFYVTGSGANGLVSRVDNAGSNFLLCNYNGADISWFKSDGSGSPSCTWIAVYSAIVQTGGSGGVVLGGGSSAWTAVSDGRVKNIWEKQTNYREAIANLWLGDFDRFETLEKSGNPVHGFGIIAQEGYRLLGPAFGFYKPENTGDLYTAPAEPMAYLALWGVQDTMARVAQLEAELAAIKTHIAV